uniref:FLYWCH-type domain-containing protein n=1 Tax=Elaeophora elaphi TaxID=1147741 RepID=A0A0R3RUH0_9BILA
MVDTGVIVVETMKSPVSSLSLTMETVQEQQPQQRPQPQQIPQPQQQQQDCNIKSLDLQCDEEFDETLAERPSTSYNHLHHQQQQEQQQQQQQSHQQQQPQQQHSTDNHVSSISNAEAIDNFAVVDSPLFNKMKREWRNYGCYTSCEEMDEVRRREKVSKRKSVTSVHGTKVFYRCNNWRRTRCNFRMYAIILTSNKICLFASGEHDHTAKDPYYVTEVINPQVERDPEVSRPSTTQQDILTQFVMNATANLLPDTDS